MFPGRFWAALGSGEASNERVTGEVWPRKDVRDARLLECVDVIRRLLAGEEVNHDGLVTVNRARLWTLPDAVPPLVGPAVTPETAARHAAWADGLVTVNQPLETLRQVLDAYRDAGGRGPARLQMHLSWAPTDDEALAIAHDQWRSNVLGPPVCWDTETVEAFDVMARRSPPSRSPRSCNVSSDPARHAALAPGVRRPGLGRALPALRRPGAGRPSSTPSASTCCPSCPPTAPPRPAGREREERPMRLSQTGDLWWKNGGVLLRRRRDLLRLRTATAPATSAA